MKFLKTDKELLRAVDVAQELGLSKETIYNWKYRAKNRKMPPGMFVTIGRKLYLNAVLLNTWLSSQLTMY